LYRILDLLTAFHHDDVVSKVGFNQWGDNGFVDS
jgi:hypothetical protein